VKFVTTKKVKSTNFFPSSFVVVVVVGSGMDKIHDPGSGINIPDPKHCLELFRVYDKITFYLFRKSKRRAERSSIIPYRYEPITLPSTQVRICDG
jgi:hypothetical protein